MVEFDPILPTVGGLLIGLATALMMIFNGRVAGISGIFSGVLSADRSQLGWKVTFVAGLLTGGLVLSLVYPGAFDLAGAPSLAALAVAGLLVGFGARLGSGCTSGHGVCGISRLSPRSVTATMTFMATGAITVFVVRHVMGGGL